MKLRHRLALAVTLSALPLTSALASASPEDEWKFIASPYFWGAGIAGDVGQFGMPEITLESSFSDIWRDLDFSFMGIAEARKGRYSLFTDIVYTKISSSGETPRGVLVDHVNVKSKTFAGVFGGGYALVKNEHGVLDWVAGARVWHASTDIALRGGRLRLDDRDAHDSDTWVNAVTGVRGRYVLSPDFYLSGWALAGAGQATLDWDVAATLGYVISDHLSVVAGYRALGVDYDDDDFVFDVKQRGPIAGLVMRF